MSKWTSLAIYKWRKFRCWINWPGLMWWPADQVVGAQMVDRVGGAQVVNQVAGVQVVVNQVAATHVADHR